METEVAVVQTSVTARADGVKYATVTHRVSRSHSVRNQEKTAGRSHTQSFALRQKKKGPPPPPPKRSSSAISSSNSNLTEANTQQQTHTTTGGMLDVPYHQQRRASDLGVSVETAEVETNSMGTVRSIAAMLEMSSIGGGAKGMALQKNYLQVYICLSTADYLHCFEKTLIILEGICHVATSDGQIGWQLCLQHIFYFFYASRVIGKFVTPYVELVPPAFCRFIYAASRRIPLDC